MLSACMFCDSSQMNLRDVNADNTLNTGDSIFSSDKIMNHCAKDSFNIFFNIDHEVIELDSTINLVLRLNHKIIYEGIYKNRLKLKIPLCKTNLYILDVFLTEEEVIYSWGNKDKYLFEEENLVSIELLTNENFNRDIGREYKMRIAPR